MRLKQGYADSVIFVLAFSLKTTTIILTVNTYAQWGGGIVKWEEGERPVMKCLRTHTCLVFAPNVTVRV